MLNYYDKEITLSTVLYWHKQLFQDTKPDIAGKIRQHQVGISGSKFHPPYPIELDLLLRDFFDWYNQNKKKLHPVHLAGLVHLKFVTIHPFGDGNGRISRLLMNYVLHKNGYPMLIIPYSQRMSYYTALERSQLKKDEKIFSSGFSNDTSKNTNTKSKTAAVNSVPERRITHYPERSDPFKLLRALQ